MSLSPNTSRLLRGLVIGIVVALACPSPAKAQTAGSPFQIQNPNSNLDWIASAYAPPAGVFLVAWEDGGVSGAQNIYGRLYDLSGAPMSPQFNICDNCGTPSGTGPHIAFDGTNFLVVWRDARDSSLFGFAGTEGFNIYGQFVDTTGGTVGANFLISDWDGGVLVDQRGPALAFDGVNYLVVFEEDNGFGNFGISGTRVNTNAASPTIIDSASPIVFRSPIVDEDALDPWVDWNGSAGMYLVTWDVDAGSGPSVEWEVQGRSIDPAATLGSVVNITSVAGSTQRFGGAVSDQTTGKWVVVWSDNRNDVSPPYDSYQAWAQAIDIDGVTLLGSNTQITTDDMWDRHASGGVDSDGIGMIAW
ncbi:MAG: hypothetical protein HYY93_03730, partial [Planctomycetes bacterium]|nr:hypothetical protein [Planctomycetota bacterium]